MDFFEVLAKRRSVRAFRKESIAPEVMTRLLEAVRSAHYPAWPGTSPGRSSMGFSFSRCSVRKVRRVEHGSSIENPNVPGFPG